MYHLGNAISMSQESSPHAKLGDLTHVMLSGIKSATTAWGLCHGIYRQAGDFSPLQPDKVFLPSQ